MKKATAAAALALLLAASLTGCGGPKEPAPVPDLKGEWEQVGGANMNFYQIATITDSTIECFWRVTEDDSEYLYWSGTFTAPETGETPYQWESVNNPRRTKISNWALRDDTKTFTYEDGKLSYIVSMGNMRMTVGLEKVS